MCRLRSIMTPIVHSATLPMNPALACVTRIPHSLAAATSTLRMSIPLRENNWPVGTAFRRVAELVANTHTFGGRKLSGTYMSLYRDSGLTKKLLAFRWMLSLVSGQPLMRPAYDGANYRHFADFFDEQYESTKAEVIRSLEKRRDDKPRKKRSRPE